MGRIKHNALIIEMSDFQSPVFDVYAEILTAVKDTMIDSRDTCSFPLELQVSRLMRSPVNGYYFVFVAPDGSKEGWVHSEYGDKFRETLFDRINSKYPESVEILDVQFGGDDEYVQTKWYSPYLDD